MSAIILATMICPFCDGSGELVYDLHADLNANVAVCNGIVVRMSPTETEILHCLLERSPHQVSANRLIEQVWGADPILTARTVLKVNVSTLRAKLAPLGWEIINRHGGGYAILKSIKEV